jgi:hypothetical protein
MNIFNKLGFQIRHLHVEISKYFFTTLGVLWLSVEITIYFVKDIKAWIEGHGLFVFLTMIISGTLYAFIKTYPKRSFSREFRQYNTKISIQTGNIIEENCNIVIGSSDYFDSDTDLNAQKSLKYQLIGKLYKGNSEEFDKLVSKSLRDQEISGTFNPAKKGGKMTQYPIGTTAVLPHENRKIFILVMSRILNENGVNYTDSNPEILHTALINLWKKLITDGRTNEIALPVLGSGLARINLPNILLMQLIVLSYLIYAKRDRVVENLKIIIYEKNYNLREFYEITRFIKSIEI